MTGLFLICIKKMDTSFNFFSFLHASNDKGLTFAVSNIKRKDNKMKKVLDLIVKCLKEIGNNILRGGYEVA